jgi:putative DNA primase/helicase
MSGDDSALAQVLARLERVRPSGDGYSAACPAHDDEHNSLSVAEGDDDRVLLWCFAGCTLEAIVHAVGLQVRDLFPRRELWR